MDMEELESICMDMIAYAGEGQSLIYEAASLFYKKDTYGCIKKIKEAEINLNRAHEIQFIKLMGPQAEGKEVPFHLLLIHAMDLLANASGQCDMLKHLCSGEMNSAK